MVKEVKGYEWWYCVYEYLEIIGFFWKKMIFYSFNNFILWNIRDFMFFIVGNFM